MANSYFSYSSICLFCYVYGYMITHNSSQCNYFSLVTKLHGAEKYFQRYFISADET